MDYSKWIVQLFGERCTKESHHHDRGSEPEWCDRCFAYAQHDEIERLREALKEIDKAIETWLPDHSPMRQALQNFTRSALQQKYSE